MGCLLSITWYSHVRNQTVCYGLWELYFGVDLKTELKILKNLDEPVDKPVYLPYIVIDQETNERYFISPPELDGSDLMHRKVINRLPLSLYTVNSFRKIIKYFYILEHTWRYFRS